MPLDNATSFSTAYYEATSPSLLASQEPNPKTVDAVPGADWDVIFSHLESRLGALRTWRYSWWSYWSELASQILPERYQFLVVSNTMARGIPLNTQIVDSTATDAMEVCAGGLWTGLTSPSRPWFELGIGLPWVTLDQEGQSWLDDAQKKLYLVLGQSNFYDTMAQMFRDVTTFGTSPPIIYEDAETVINCYLPCAGEYYLGVGARLTVDTLYREFNLTTLGLVDMFGVENVPPEVQEMWTTGGGSLESEFIVAHAIEPNFELSNRAGGKVRVAPGVFPFREVYWLRGKKTRRELSRRGFHEPPFFAARWSKRSNDAYGRSPGMKILGDAKQLQVMTRRIAEFEEKLVRPPMVADVNMKNEPASILPGHITYTNAGGGRDGFKPAFEINASSLAPMLATLQQVQNRIKHGLYVDLFMAITQMEGVQPRNELELTKRDLERLQQIGPFISLFTTEVADPALFRVMEIMRRRGLLRPLPQSLRGVPLKFTYHSILRQAQIASETATMERTFQVAGGLSAAAKAAGRPDPIDNINLDKALRIYGEKTSFPADCWFTEDQVAEQRAAKQQAQQQAQMLKTTLPAVQAAKTASEIQVGGGRNILAAAIGAG